MESNRWKFVLNKEFLIKYDEKNVFIYKIELNDKTMLLFQFKSEISITFIQFNPLVDNIIILSFNNGTCKIYNLLNKSDKEEILFECIKKEDIKFSLFNIFDPNIIVTKNSNQDIYIWDVRKLFYLFVINMEENLDNIKWSHYGSDYIEMGDVKKKEKNGEVKVFTILRLINIKTKEEKFNEKIEGKVQIKKEKIEKIERIKKIDSSKEEEKISTLKIEKIIKSNENLLKDYNILIIISEKYSYFIDIIEFKIIKIVEQIFFNLFYIKGEDIICLKLNEDSELIEKYSFNLNEIKEKQISEENLINIRNNFYDKFCPKILKYMCLLNFNENIKVLNDNRKNYMGIKTINDYFNTIKEVNIFSRKDFVTQLLDLNIIDNKTIELNDELNINKFPKIRNFLEIYLINNLADRKKRYIQLLKNNLNDNEIINYYIELVKLLTIDNTNKKLIEMYLLFIQLYEYNLIKIFSQKLIEKYKEEVKYYSVCFSKEEYKELFNEEKISEKDILFDLLTRAYKLAEFNYNNPDFKNFINDLKETYKYFPDFNQPIEYDGDNEELKWFSAKINIITTFKNLDSDNYSKDELTEIRAGLKTVMENKLLKNEDILNNKYKFLSVIYLITTPCPLVTYDNSLQFFINSLLSPKNNIEELQKKYKVNKEKQLVYENEIYDNIEDICVDNLPFKGYTKEEKYNFDYLLNNYVKNQDNIKKFLKNILNKRVFKEAYSILFENQTYKLSDKIYLDEFINKRLKFAPIRPSNTVAISNKISLTTFISTQDRTSGLKSNKIELKILKEILNTARYVLTEEHEIFHLLVCLPYYENNCTVSIDTPKKEKYEGKEEGGIYLELLLFNKEVKRISLGDALFLLNENNYDKSLGDFVTSFEKKDYKDLIINGVFSDFNNYLNIKNMTAGELNNPLIELKYYSNSIFDPYITIELEKDLSGKLYKK